MFKYCGSRRVQGVISATTVIDILYILRKHIDRNGVRVAVQTILLRATERISINQKSKLFRPQRP